MHSIPDGICPYYAFYPRWDLSLLCILSPMGSVPTLPSLSDGICPYYAFYPRWDLSLLCILSGMDLSLVSLLMGLSLVSIPATLARFPTFPLGSIDAKGLPPRSNRGPRRKRQGTWSAGTNRCDSLWEDNWEEKRKTNAC